MFVLNFLVVWENGLIRNLRLISEFMISQPGRQIITIHTLPNISKSKDNQTMKFGQLIEYHLRNIFLQKSNRLSVFFQDHAVHSKSSNTQQHRM